MQKNVALMCFTVKTKVKDSNKQFSLNDKHVRLLKKLVVTIIWVNDTYFGAFTSHQSIIHFDLTRIFFVHCKYIL